MELRPNKPLDDKSLGKQTKSTIGGGFNSSSDKDARALWWFIVVFLTFLFSFAPLVLRIFTRKRIGSGVLGFLAVLAAFAWTRVFYILTIQLSPCKGFGANCPDFNLGTVDSLIEGLNYGEIFLPWKIWFPEFPSWLPLYGTIILVFGVFHVIRILRLPADSSEYQYERGFSVLTAFYKKFNAEATERQVRLVIEPLAIVLFSILVLVLGDWRFATALVFALICLIFEELRADYNRKDKKRVLKQGQLEGEYVSELSQNLNTSKEKGNENEYLSEEKEGRNKAKI